MRLAPGHQRLAGEAGIGAQQDAHPRPAGADLADDAGDLVDRPGRGVDVGTPQPRRQQVAAAEDVERQVAVGVVVAVEEAAFLMPVQRDVGGVEVEDDLPRRRAVRVEEQIDEQRLDRRGIMADAVIAARLARRGVFQPVQRDGTPTRNARWDPTLPASGAQPGRRASSLPARTASTGSS